MEKAKRKQEGSSYEMKGRPQGMPLEEWYEKIYSQWYNRETWCEMYMRPLLQDLKHRRHFRKWNRSTITFDQARKPMVFTMRDRSRGVIFEPGRRCFQNSCFSYLDNYF